MSTSNRIIKNTGFLYGRMAITVFISLYSTRLILNSLGVSDFGIFGIVGGAIGMLSFLDSSMAQATQRFMSLVEGQGDNEKKIKVFNVSLVLHIGIACIVGLMLEMALFIFFASVLNIPPERVHAGKCIYHFMVLSAMFTIITVPFDAAINSHENMLFYGIIGILESVLKLAVAIGLVFFGKDKLILYGLFITLITITTLLIKKLYCYMNYVECKFMPKKYFDRFILVDITRFAGWNLVSLVGVIVGNYGSGLVMNHFFGTAVNAAQSITGQLNGQLLAFSNNMLKALNPAIVKKEGGGDREAMLKLSFTGCKLSYMLLAVFAIPFLIEAPYILQLWLKNTPVWTVIFFRLFVITTMLQQFTITFNTTIGAVGRIREVSLFNSLICLLPNVVYIVIFSFGASPVWLYIIALVNLGIINGVYLAYKCKKICGLDLRIFFKNVVLSNLAATLIAVLVGCSVAVFQEESYVRLIEIVFICSSVYLFFTFRFVLSNEEKQIVRKIFQKFLPKTGLNIIP